MIPVALSIVIPARNEAASIGKLVRRIAELHPDAEIIVVNDASIDDTAELAMDAGASVINHPYAKGNGASIKAGRAQRRATCWCSWMATGSIQRMI